MLKQGCSSEVRKLLAPVPHHVPPIRRTVSLGITVGLFSEWWNLTMPINLNKNSIVSADLDAQSLCVPMLDRKHITFQA